VQRVLPALRGRAFAPRLTRLLGNGRALVVAGSLEAVATLIVVLALLGTPVLWIAAGLAARGFFNPLW
jgi:hypothetical protein